MRRFLLALLLALLWVAPGHAQTTQCQTPAVGGSNPIANGANCASQAFVTDHFPNGAQTGHLAIYADPSGQLLQDGGAPNTNNGTVTEQKNTASAGIITSGNCDNTSTNAASPCNAAIDYATKSDQQTGTTGVKTISPLHQQDHDSADKAWVAFNASGTILSSYNVTSVSRTATGKFTITFTVAFANINYECNISSENNANSTSAIVAVIDSTAIPKTASTASLIFLNAGATAFANPDVGHLSCRGRQ